ncbi:MAG: ABC transporter ATP-binding protein [Rhodocyclaceae bacterium]
MTSPDSATWRAAGAPPLPGTPLRFIAYFVARFRYWYATMLLLETATAACSIMMPYALNRIIKGVTGADGPGHDLVDALSFPLMLFVGFSIGEVVFGRSAGAIQVRLGPRQRQNVTRQLYHYLQEHSHRYFANNFSGALAHRISETAMGVTQTLWSLITEFWPIAIVLGLSTVLLYNAHAVLGLFAAIWAVCFIGISYLLAKRCQPHALKAAAARSMVTGVVVDSITNLTSARLFSRLGYERDHLAAAQAEELRAVRVSGDYSERVRWFQFSAAAALKIGLLYFSLRLLGQGRISVGDFVMAITLSLSIINEARNLSRRFLEFFEYLGNVANGVQTIVRPHEIVDAPDARDIPVRCGHIEFRQVDFGYSPDSRVFNNLNVTIPAGQRVGLVGLSGSGKTSFVSLLLRLYDPQGGAILIDGADLRAMTQDALHEQLALIPQDPSLFHRTLMENIRYGRVEASDAEVREAARMAYADEFIGHMKEGYESLVGERGVKLSGGQRQRIAIARVILKNAPVLILDEATSALDSITERAIQDTLDDVMKGKTVIVVAHRLSTISHLDRILVFDAGRIVEDGSHDELLARQGAYYALWSRQAGGFLPQQSSAGVLRPAVSDNEEGAPAVADDEDTRDSGRRDGADAAEPVTRA